MIFQTDDWPVQFLESEYGLFLDNELKPHAEGILNLFIQTAKKFNPQFPSNLTQSILDAILVEKMLLLNLSADSKKQIPTLITDFFKFLELSGVYPPASEWEELIKVSGEKFNNRFRTDGSFKGESFKRDNEKIGRNHPCPCNSGKKYKACCGK